MNPVPSSAAAGGAPAAGSPPAARALGRPGVAWAVLALCLLATTIGWRISLSQVKERAHDRFDLLVGRVTQAIRERIMGYEQVLKGAGGLFAASTSVQRDEWRAYVASLDLEARYRGIHALGYIASVTEEQREQFLTATRQDEAPQFTIQPPGVRSNYYVVQYVEPAAASPPLGLDIATESRWREAVDLARDTGEIVLTGRIKLTHQDEDLPAALLAFPIYRHGQPRTTLDQRRAARREGPRPGASV